MTTEAKILYSELPRLEKRIKTLNKRANLLNLRSITLTVGEPYIDVSGGTKENPWYNQWVDVIIDGEVPTIKDWTPVAVLDRLNGSNLVSKIDYDVEIPEEYRHNPLTCDHCNTKRQRSKVLVIRHISGKYMQIGTGCLDKYLGYKDPHKLVEYLTWVTSKHEKDYSSSNGPQWYSVKEYIEHVAAMTRTEGFRKTVNEYETGSTRQSAMVNMIPHIQPKDYKPVVITAEDKDKATKALEWILNSTDNSDYIYNLKTACNSEYFPYKVSGLLASLVYAYERNLISETEYQEKKNQWAQEKEEREAARKAEMLEGPFIGSIGENLEAKVTYISTRWFEGDYGTCYIHSFNYKGSMLCWFTSSKSFDNLQKGQLIAISGTVKEHKEYREQLQTMLTRCKIAIL